MKAGFSVKTGLRSVDPLFSEIMFYFLAARRYFARVEEGNQEDE